jgi:hypothetical protein
VGSQLVLGWKVSDYIQDSFATFNVYDGFECEEGSNDITDKISDIQNGDAYFQTLGLRPDSTTPYEADPNTSGDGVRDMRLFLSIQANGITKVRLPYIVDASPFVFFRLTLYVRHLLEGSHLLRNYNE